MPCPRSHSKVLIRKQIFTLFPEAYCPSSEKQGESRREERNSQSENAAPERKTSGGPEFKLSQGPGSKLRRRLPCGWVARWPPGASPGRVGMGSKESDYRAGRLKERERENK